MERYKEQMLGGMTDFNGDKVDDYALLLRDENNEVCLFVFDVSSNNIEHYLVDCFDNWTGAMTNFKVEIEPKGDWETIDEVIEVPFDGISVEDREASRSRTYYWNKGKFVRVFFD